jgi:hypothetical protein
VENRLKCKLPSRIMAWTVEPEVRADWFTLFGGSDESKPITSYVPGQRMTISLRVKAYNQQYRGLLMYAYKGTDKETKVGDWDFTDRETMFHSYCPQSVIHTGAAVKPYLTSWVFTAPPKGTGQISIWALLKIGVANEGEFYFPNLLTLQEATTEPAPQVWFRARTAGQSCDEVCAANCNKQCDATKLQDLDTPEKFDTLAGAYASCNKPLLVRCNADGATSTNSSLCFMHAPSACQRVGLPFTASTCAAKPAANSPAPFRFCPCTGGQDPCLPPPPSTVVPTTRPPRTLPAPTSPQPIAIDECERTANCKAGCKCVAPRVCELGLALKDGICLAAGGCDPASPTNGCPCTDKCGTAVVGGQTENLVCKAGYCTLVLRRTCDDHLGTAGCWCTEKRTCDAGLICSAKSNNCVLDDECAPGSQGCTCMSGKCNQGLQCAKVSDGQFCVIGTDMVTSASTVALSLLAAVVTLGAAML